MNPWVQNSVTIPTRNWYKCNCVRVVDNFLNIGADFFNGFLIFLLAVGWLSGTILTPTISCFTLSVSQKGTLVGLHILGDACFKLTSTSSNNQDSTASLRCACHHIFDKVSVSWGINDGSITLDSPKFLPAGINGDTFQLSDYPRPGRA